MDSKTNHVPIIIGGVVVLAVIAFGMYAFMQKDTQMSEGEMMQKEEGMMKDEGAMMDKDAMEEDTMMKDEDAMMQKGSYEAYSADKLARAETGDVVLFFHASWCPSCRGLNTDIEQHIEAIPSDVSILKVDYDSESEMKKKYGVTYQHTLVQVDVNGNLIKKWSGSPTLSSLVSEIQ